MQYMRQNPDLLWVRTDFEQPEPVVEVTLDEKAASRLGLNRQTTSLQLMSHTNDRFVTTIWEDDYGLPVVLKDNSWGNADFDKFDNLPVQPMTSAKTVPLRQIAQIPMIENDDKPNKLTTLIFNIIAIVGVAVVFRLLPRFSQKVHLLYP